MLMQTESLPIHMCIVWLSCVIPISHPSSWTISPPGTFPHFLISTVCCTVFETFSAPGPYYWLQLVQHLKIWYIQMTGSWGRWLCCFQQSGDCYTSLFFYSSNPTATVPKLCQVYLSNVTSKMWCNYHFCQFSAVFYNDHQRSIGMILLYLLLAPEPVGFL